MAKPRIFISSTYYDLRHIRASLETFVQSLGYDPVLSEKGNIAYTPDIALDESCYREAAGADLLVLIIGSRYGTEKSDSRTSHTFFERYDSITKQEYKSALNNNIPIYILVDSQVYVEYQTFLKNKSNNQITYAHVDSVSVFYLLEEILNLKRNNALNTFSKYTDIEDWLREQWAGYFRELLKRTTQSQEIASLSSQVLQLSELNKTLKTYLESLITAISPDKSKAQEVIKTESTRLEEVQKQSELNKNMFAKFLARTCEISSEMVREIIEEPKDWKGFEKRIRAFPNHAQTIGTIRRSKEAQRDFNDARRILNRRPFIFDNDPETMESVESPPSRAARAHTGG